MGGLVLIDLEQISDKYSNILVRRQVWKRGYF